MKVARSKSVLLIEKGKSYRERWHASLLECGCNVRSVSTALAAEYELLNLKPDLLLIGHAEPYRDVLMLAEQSKQRIPELVLVVLIDIDVIIDEEYIPQMRHIGANILQAKAIKLEKVLVEFLEQSR